MSEEKDIKEVKEAPSREPAGKDEEVRKPKVHKERKPKIRTLTIEQLEEEITNVKAKMGGLQSSYALALIDQLNFLKQKAPQETVRKAA